MLFIIIFVFERNEIFSLSETYRQGKSCSTEQDLNPHPSLSRQVPLPLAHLHYFLSLSSNSQLRAFYCLVQDLIKHALLSSNDLVV